LDPKHCLYSNFVLPNLCDTKQVKLLSAKVLYVNISGTSLEILKNLVLAGVQPAIFDGRPYMDTISNKPTPLINKFKAEVDVAEYDATAKRPRLNSASVASFIRPIVHEMNPLLEECVIDERPLSSIPDHEFSKFDVVIASHISKADAIRIAKATVGAGGKFILVDSFGLMGCAVLDMGKDHLFRREEGKDKLSHPTTNSNYVPFETIITLELSNMKKGRWDKFPPLPWAIYKSYLDFQQFHGHFPSNTTSDQFVDFAKNWLKDQSKGNGLHVSDDLFGSTEEIKCLACIANEEVSPVCAVLGGVVGNEVIKCLSGKGEPANNVLLFEGAESSCRAFFVCSTIDQT